jgi:CheY-like chemotaxis protein
MDVTCENCNAKLVIPDEKLPQDQQAFISCPRCDHRQAVDIHPSKKDGSLHAAGKDPDSAGEARDGERYAASDSLVDFSEDWKKLALVMENDVQQVDRLRKTVEALGYRYVSAENIPTAINKMRHNHFDLILLFDRFDGVDLTQSPILEYLNSIPLSVRRRIFLALIGDGFKTMDHMTAFVMSANMVIAGKDLERLLAILQHGIADNDFFYKAFRETLAETGKA